jgi:predicted RecA/RadA family phage recombinase
MSFEGQPVPSTVYKSNRAKIGDGKSVRVVVPQSTTVESQKFYLFDGFFGVAMQDVETGAGETDELILNIEEAEFEADQIDTTQDYAIGTPVFWDSTNSVFSETATGNRFVGVVTSSKDANNVIWLKLSPQANGIVQGTDVANISTDMSADVNDQELKTTLNSLLTNLRAAGIIG